MRHPCAYCFAKGLRTFFTVTAPLLHFSLFVPIIIIVVPPILSVIIIIPFLHLTPSLHTLFPFLPHLLPSIDITVLGPNLFSIFAFSPRFFSGPELSYSICLFAIDTPVFKPCLNPIFKLFPVSLATIFAIML